MDPPRMDGFDVQALAWMVFFNLAKFPERERETLAALITDVTSSSYADLGKLNWCERMLRPRSHLRSKATLTATKKALEFAQSVRPDVFSYQAVRTYMWIWMARSLGAFGACVILFRSLPLPLAGVPGWATMGLFLLAFLFFTIGIQRWFVSVMIRRFGLSQCSTQCKTPP